LSDLFLEAYDNGYAFKEQNFRKKIKQDLDNPVEIDGIIYQIIKPDGVRYNVLTAKRSGTVPYRSALLD